MFLFALFGPRPSRPRWQSKDRRRSDRTSKRPQCNGGRVEAAFLDREEWRAAPGEESRSRPLRENDRGEAGFRSDMPNRAAERAGSGGERNANDSFVGTRPRKYRGPHRKGPDRCQHCRMARRTSADRPAPDTPSAGCRRLGRSDVVEPASCSTCEAGRYELLCVASSQPDESRRKSLSRPTPRARGLEGGLLGRSGTQVVRAIGSGALRHKQCTPGTARGKAEIHLTGCG